MKQRVIFFLLTFMAFATLYGQSKEEKITIKGLVVDVDKKPVTNAIVFIDNEKTNKTTGQNGFYKIKVRKSSGKVGIFTNQTGLIEESINGRTTVNFTLGISAQQEAKGQNNTYIDEEINIGYGSVKRKNLTQPVSRMDRRSSMNESYTSIYEMIQGKIPGVQVIGTSILIQGVSSLNSSTEPLFVVDGIMVNSIDHISPNMVRSIEVLKGSAAAIYGSRGANGVILINLINAKDLK